MEKIRTEELLIVKGGCFLGFATNLLISLINIFGLTKALRKLRG